MKGADFFCLQVLSVFLPSFVPTLSFGNCDLHPSSLDSPRAAREWTVASAQLQLAAFLSKK